jgi:hypothetical protein
MQHPRNMPLCPQQSYYYLLSYHPNSCATVPRLGTTKILTVFYHLAGSQHLVRDGAWILKNTNKNFLRYYFLSWTHMCTHTLAGTRAHTKTAVWAEMRNSSGTTKITLLAKDKWVLIKTLTHYLFLEKPGKNEKMSQHESQRHTGLLYV